MVKNSLAVLVRVMEQAEQEGLRDAEPARVRGWQELYKQVEDELKDTRALAIPDWEALLALCDATSAISIWCGIPCGTRV
ncbi:hypothetical protein ACFYTQ_24515 [Nocardia sp. NPDC004068]|uniref:hypothetical protein n=1 Tax=Nocardia sp. NPDC004068 TaxID=3364303 RepID=UPI0036C550F5